MLPLYCRCGVFLALTALPFLSPAAHGLAVDKVLYQNLSFANFANRIEVSPCPQSGVEVEGYEGRDASLLLEATYWFVCRGLQGD